MKEQKRLVAYFSASGITRTVGEKLGKAVHADCVEIVPEIPYSRDDLNWMDKQARSTIEMQNKSFRPAIATPKKEIIMESYDIIFLGFPIWWYVAPTIIHTFLEQYDFSGKSIVLFATSGGSGFGNTVSEFSGSCAESTKIIEGKIFHRTVLETDLIRWVESLKLQEERYDNC